MTAFAPILDFRAARSAMVDSQLRPQGVTDPAVVRAMGMVEREQFAPAQARTLAYVDRALPLGGGRFLAAPAMLGQLLTQLAPVEGERVLVVGSGPGYSAAVLAAMGLEVVALDCSADLAAIAGAQGVTTVEGDLASGWPSGAPYDLILIDGAVSHLPEAIIGQLADGGRLGTALISGTIPRLIIGRKSGAAFGYYSIGDVGAPVLPGFDRPQTFTF